MRVFVTLSSFFALSQLMACGPDCQSTCTKIYESTQCNIGEQRPGSSPSELLKQCMSYCESGLSKPGPAGDYNPNEQIPRSETPELKTDQQTALWMDCVANTACENLEKNYCAPIW